MKIQTLREMNGERVVVMCHSMGNRTFQYFLQWVKMLDGQDWIDKNVHAFFALGAPFLGAPKTVRAIVSGDQMGLEVFLTPEEGRTLSRRSASLPWLFPIQEDLFPDVIARVLDSSAPSESVDLKSMKRKSSKKIGIPVLDATYKEFSVSEIASLASEVSKIYLYNMKICFITND